MTEPKLVLERIDTYAEGGWVERPVLTGRLGETVPVNMSRWYVPPGTHSDAEHHQDDEVWMIGCGSGELTFDDRSVRVRKGDVVHLPPNACHQVHNDGIEDLEVFSIWWLE